MQSKGGCAEDPVSAVMLPQTLGAPGERAEQFGRQPCCLCTSCKDHSQAGTHPSLGPASSALGFAWTVPMVALAYPLYWHRCSVQPQHGGLGQREGAGGALFRLLVAGGGDRQGSAPLGLALMPSTPGSLHPWSPSTLGSEVGLAQCLIPICLAALGGGAGLSP